MKKVSIILAGILLITIAGVLFYLKKQKMPEFEILNTIPTDVAFLLDIQDPDNFFTALSQDNEIWSELVQMESSESVKNHMHDIDSLIKDDNFLHDKLKNRRIIISGKKSGKNNMSYLLAMNVENLREQKHLESILQKYSAAKGKTFRTNTYNKEKTYYIENNNKRSLTYSFVNGILLIGNNSLIVENAIRQSNVKHSIDDQPDFQKVAKTAGKNVAANLYINYRTLGAVIENLINKTYRKELDFISNFGTWASLDFNIRSDALLLNGFSSGVLEKKELIDLFKNQEPIKHDIKEILPANTSTFLNLGISNKEQYFEKFEEYLQQNDELGEYNNTLEEIEKKFGFNAKETIYELLHEEVGLAFLNGNMSNASDNGFIIMKTKGKRFTENLLVELSRKACNQTNQRHQQNLQIDDEISYKVYRLPIENLFGKIFGSLFKGFSNNYFTIIDNYVIFAESTEILQQFIYSNILNKTLKNDPHYNQFDDFLSDNSNFHFYSNLYRSPQLISNYLNTDLQQEVDKNLTHIRKFQAFAYQFLGNGDMIYNNVFLKFIPEINEEPKTIWECHLDTNIRTKPTFVTNHYTKEKEIFVQDEDNTIYLINKIGRVLWKKNLDEKINSEIYQIDFYENSKLQLLFSTKNKLHLIDRNGNYVEDYPKKLPSPATAGMSLFDYEDTKEYRIFVPCENRKVYNFNKEGDIIKGWQFENTDTRVTQPVQHFRVGTKDYIVFADQYRVYILNRRGETRVQPETQFKKSKNNIFILEENTDKKPKLVTTDSKGKIHYVYFSGKVESTSIDEFSENHWFDYKDITGNGKKNIIFLDNNTLKVYKQNGEKLFTRNFDTKISGPPLYFEFSAREHKLGLVAREANEIYLINQDGKLYEGFPLQGNTPFSIGFLEQPKRNFNLIVGNKYSFMYNYSVN
ncbi:MAG: DUF3352 domain-containing protein [Bacteroidales bacterium]